MKERVEDLIEHHRMALHEVKNILDELSKIDKVKMSQDENNSLILMITRYQEERDMRKIFLDDLQDLL